MYPAHVFVDAHASPSLAAEIDTVRERGGWIVVGFDDFQDLLRRDFAGEFGRVRPDGAVVAGDNATGGFAASEDLLIDVRLPRHGLIWVRANIGDLARRETGEGSRELLHALTESQYETGRNEYSRSTRLRQHRLCLSAKTAIRATSKITASFCLSLNICSQHT